MRGRDSGRSGNVVGERRKPPPPGLRSRLSRTPAPKRVRVPYPNLCINSPLRSFGSNQVDLGGMRSPASATANSSSMEVGYMENAASISSDTLRSTLL